MALRSIYHWSSFLPLDEEDYHRVVGNEAEKFSRFYYSPVPSRRYQTVPNWSYLSHHNDSYLLSELFFLVLSLFFPFLLNYIIKPTTQQRGLVLLTGSCFTCTAHHVTGRFSISQYKFTFAPALLCLRFPKPSLLPDLTFLNYATLILRKQNAGWYSHEFLYTLSLSTGLIQLNSS